MMDRKKVITEAEKGEKGTKSCGKGEVGQKEEEKAERRKNNRSGYVPVSQTAVYVCVSLCALVYHTKLSAAGTPDTW